MKRKISYLLVGAVAFVSLGLLNSCKDYDYSDELRHEFKAADADLQKQIDELKAALAQIKSCECNFIENGELTEFGKTVIYRYLNELGYCTWTIGADGYWYKDGVKTDYKAIGQDGLNGVDGKDADKWTIGEDGYWYINGEKTSFKAVGKDGLNGKDGDDGQNGKDADVWTIGNDGYWYKNGQKTDYKAVGQDGKDAVGGDTWTIGDDGYWYKNGEKTDKKAVGSDGKDGNDGAAWTIGTDGYWYLNGEKTDYKAIGKDGKDGNNGHDGSNATVWTIGTDGYWYKDGVKTSYKAIGEPGKDGKDGATWTIGDDGYWYLNGEKTDYKAIGKDGEDGDGKTPFIGDNGNWWIGTTDTGVPATGPKGKDGVDGKDGSTPNIDDEGYWTLDGVRILINGQPVKAIGTDGKDGVDGTDGLTPFIGDNGNWWIGTTDTGIPAQGLTKEEIEKIVETAIENYPYIKHLKEVHDAIVNSYTTLGYSSLPDYMEKVDAQVKENTKAIEQIKKDIEELKEKVEKLEKAEKKYISGIIINEVENPIFGSFNLPADVRSSILFGYFGEAVQGGEFPSAVSDGYYVDPKYALSDADFAMISPSTYKYFSGDVLIEDGENGDNLNIGKLYLTVNPTKIDYSGTDFTLVNSKNEESKAQLSPLKPSTKTISFGYTRAAIESESSNGFYETELKFAKADVKKNAISTEGVLDEAKEILKNLKAAEVEVDKDGNVTVKSGQIFDLSSLAMTIYNNINNVCDAYAVKATWNDDVAGERSVLSQYGVATATLKAIGGYSSFKDFDYKTVPGYEIAWNIIDKIANVVKTQMKDGWPDFSALTMPTIKYVTFEKPKADGTYAINITLSFEAESGYKYTVEEDGYVHIYDAADNRVGRVKFGHVTKNAKGDIVITVYSYEKDLYATLGPLFDAIDEAFDDVNQTYDDLNDLMTDIDGILNDLNKLQGQLEKASDKFATILHNWLKYANSRIVNFVNSVNYRLQPILVTTNSNGSHLTSSAKSYPTFIPSSTDFVLTNYTGEILAPALKKHLACTNVFKDGASAQGGDGACKSALTAVNKGELNTILPGSTFIISASGFQKGYVYELSLSALDYEGMQTTRKFYVTVK